MPAGYGIAKAGAQGRRSLILIARITPGLSYLIPLFLLFQWLGMIGTLTPLMITHLVITVPIVVWIMIGFFERTPLELEEAALVDGATIWQAFRHVAMPLARPGITVAMILAFIFSWNNFIFGVVLAGRTTRTLPVAVYNMLSFEQISWGPLAAAALVVTAPVLLLTLFAEGDRRRPDRRRGERRLTLPSDLWQNPPQSPAAIDETDMPAPKPPAFETLSLHAGQHPDPVDRRARGADLPDHVLRVSRIPTMRPRCSISNAPATSIRASPIRPPPCSKSGSRRWKAASARSAPRAAWRRCISPSPRC